MSCSKPIQALSFAKIIKGRDASVRVTPDYMIYVVDLVMVAHGSDRRYVCMNMVCRIGIFTGCMMHPEIFYRMHHACIIK